MDAVISRGVAQDSPLFRDPLGYSRSLVHTWGVYAENLGDHIYYFRTVAKYHRTSSVFLDCFKADKRLISAVLT